MIRVVFDTNVLYSAILKPASIPAKAVDLIAAGIVIPCISPPVLTEYENVLYRRELDLNGERRHELLRTLVGLSLPVVPTETLEISRDEADNRFLECASAAVADFLVTGNIRHFPRAYGPTVIVSPKQFLALVASEEP